MKQNSCKYATNNKYFDCPPRMADGRHFTDYRPNCDLNNTQGLNNNQYRNHLVRDAETIMENNRSAMCDKNCNGHCVEPYNVGTMLPEKSLVICNKNTCKTVVNNANGIGQGRLYATEPVPDTLVPQPTKPRARNTECCGNPGEIFNYYGDNLQETGFEYLNRTTVQDGGKAMSGGDPGSYSI